MQAIHAIKYTEEKHKRRTDTSITRLTLQATAQYHL